MAREARGLGDRWLAGEELPGVRFGLHDAVRVVGGEHAGTGGRVVLLARVAPRVEYVVTVDRRAVRVDQDDLRCG